MHGVKAEFLRVAFAQKVLPIHVRDSHLLTSQSTKRVQTAVRVLLQPVEKREVVLVAVRRPVAEQARAEIRIAEDEATEVARKRLRSDPHGYEVIIRREIVQFALVEKFLH